MNDFIQNKVIPFAQKIENNFILSAISGAFMKVMPALLGGALFLLVRSGFAVTSYGNIQNFIYTMVQAPLVSLGNSFPAMLISMLILLLLWWVGIHGTSVVLSVMMVIWMEPAITNLNNYMAGEPVTLVTTYMFFFVFCQFIGGPGCLFGLTCDMAIFAKSERFKAFGKVCFVPGMFNIVEPVIFGFPIVLNPIMFIPFILTPLVFMIIGYLLMVTGVVNIPALMLSVMTIPGPIAGFILGGGISLGIMIVIMCLLSCIIYYPFFKICDNQALEAEKKSNQEKTLEENKI